MAACSVDEGTSFIIADPDIAGIGVIAAFVASAGITSIACCLYIMLAALIEPTHNFAAKSRAKLISAKILSSDDLQLRRIFAALERLIITLSDQQIITGIAILVAAYRRWNSIQIYHWEIISDLAYCSSTVHVATLVAVRKHLRHEALRPLLVMRLMAMFAIFIMLFVANTYTGYRYWDDYLSRPMRCVASDLRYDLRAYWGGTPGRQSALWMAILIWDYSGAYASFSDSYLNSIRIWRDDRLLWAKTKVRLHYSRLEKQFSWYELIALLLRWPFYLFFIVLRVIDTGTFFILSLIAFFLYSTTAMLLWREYGNEYLDDPRKEADISGFGQVVPLVLLVLPAIAFLEAYLLY